MTGSVERGVGDAGSPIYEQRPAGPANRVPDFFLVGHPKSGTTALYEMLRRHPQIYMPDVKEPSYLAADQRRRYQPSWAGPLPETLEQYLQLFAPARPDQVAGEASSAYLVSTLAAARIASLNPGARAIAVLREPAELLRSLHLQLLQDRIEDVADLRTALALERRRREGLDVPAGSPRPQALLYSERVRFVEQLRRYSDALSPERVLVLVYDDFRADNAATARRVLRFLGVEDTVELEAVQVNPTVRVRSRRLDDLVHAVSSGRGPVGRAVKGGVKALAPRRVRREALTAVRRRVVLAQPPPIDGELMLELRRRYRDEVLAVSEYLGRDLVREWGYDRLG